MRTYGINIVRLITKEARPLKNKYLLIEYKYSISKPSHVKVYNVKFKNFIK